MSDHTVHPDTRRIDVLTTFPEMFATAEAGEEGGARFGPLNHSIPARARRARLVEWHAHNLRDFTHDKHQKTDDRPFGGGPGMVMTCQPLFDAVLAVEALDPRPTRRVLLTPQGRLLRQPLVEELAREPRLLLIAGHYEGVDERVIEELKPLEVSLGDYVLSGGELAAMVLMDAVIRLYPGALGHETSAAEDSFSPVDLPRLSRRERELLRELGWTEAPSDPASPVPSRASAPGDAEPRLLDCPHYAKPREWRGRLVPDVLLSGDHGAIARWRLEQRIRRTLARRPDLAPPGIERYLLLGEQPPGPGTTG